MNQDDFNSALATIDAGTRAHHLLFQRASAIWQLAQDALTEYQPRLEQAGLNFDQIESLCEDTIFAYSDRKPYSLRLDGTTQTATLSLRQPFGEHWIDSIQFPYAWFTMSDAELIAHFRSILDGWIEAAQAKRAAQDRQDEEDRRAQYQDLKAEFEPAKS